MYRPFLSYSIAIFIYAFLLLLGFNFVKKPIFQPPISLQIEAIISDQKNLGNLHQHESPKQVVEKAPANSHQQNHLESDKISKAEKKNTTTNASEKAIATNTKPLYQILPEIPDDMRYEAMKSQAIARFYIDKNGSVNKVELLKPTNVPKLNYLLLKSLKQWQFSPSNQSLTQDIKIDFEVK